MASHVDAETDPIKLHTAINGDLEFHQTMLAAGERHGSLQAIAKRRPEWECGAARVGAPMLCLCTTPGQDGLTARRLVVRASAWPERLGTPHP